MGCWHCFSSKILGGNRLLSQDLGGQHWLYIRHRGKVNLKRLLWGRTLGLRPVFVFLAAGDLNNLIHVFIETIAVNSCQQYEVLQMAMITCGTRLTLTKYNPHVKLFLWCVSIWHGVGRTVSDSFGDIPPLPLPYKLKLYVSNNSAWRSSENKKLVTILRIWNFPLAANQSFKTQVSKSAKAILAKLQTSSVEESSWAKERINPNILQYNAQFEELILNTCNTSLLCMSSLNNLISDICLTSIQLHTYLGKNFKKWKTTKIIFLQ